MASTSGTSTLRKKLDRFWSVLFLTPEGRPKSAMLLYSFCMSLVFMVVYGVSYFFLIDALETVLAGASVAARNAAQCVIPGLCGSVVCCATYFVFSDRRIVPAAYVWLTLFALAVLVTMALLAEDGTYPIFLYFYAMLVPVGLLSGAAFTHYLYGRRLRSARRGETPQET